MLLKRSYMARKRYNNVLIASFLDAQLCGATLYSYSLGSCVELNVYVNLSLIGLKL